ncbi:MAG: ABC transporter ATP-binding protein, partial [Candidatus Dadabacteria bacterium]|nr:ABC transporter ATP-binding protein [Candidatus Dadabacteria bacterium]NIQ14734.1 ABC transporter ATP-binding protein [Candidatus Dadabacteria bacterium]
STIALEGEGQINEYLGGYDDWVKQRKVEAEIIIEKPKTTEKTEKPKNKKKGLSYRENKELEELPMLIQNFEQEQKDLITILSNPEIYKNDPDRVNESKKRLDELELEISEAFEKWDYLEGLKDNI